MADFLDEKRDEIAARLKQLRPLVDEYERLRAAATALEGISAPAAPAGVTSRESRASTSASTSSKTAAGRRPRAKSSARRGRPRRSGTRGAQALQLVKDNPGITIAQIAEKMGIKQNYLYRVLPALAEEGLLAKDGRGWRANEPADVPPAS